VLGGLSQAYSGFPDKMKWSDPSRHKQGENRKKQQLDDINCYLTIYEKKTDSKSNFKLTDPRAIILDCLKDNYSHPSVEDVFIQVREKLPTISKKTVYNNLQFLCSKGLIKEVKVKGVQRYEPDIGPHMHAICRKCGSIIDVESQELYAHAMKVAKKIRSFDTETPEIVFYGICKRCKGGEKDGRR